MNSIQKIIHAVFTLKINFSYNRIEDGNYELCDLFRDEFKKMTKGIKNPQDIEWAEDEMIDLNDCSISVTGCSKTHMIYLYYYPLTDEVSVTKEAI